MASIFISSVSPRFIKRSQPCSGPSRPPLNPVLLDLSLRLFKQSHPHICKNFRSFSKFSTICCLSSTSTEKNSIIGDDVSKKKILETDAPWIYSCLPQQLKPFVRLTRLDSKEIWIGWFDYPILCSMLWTANPGHLPDLKLFLPLYCSGLFLKIYVTTINDFVDQDIDRQVERSRNRPFASGELTTFQGLFFVGIQLLSSLGPGMLLKFDKLSWTLWTTQLLLFFIYPFMKRLTYWPQAFVALAFAWETLLGWKIVKGNMDLAILLPQFAATVFWALVAETIYGHQDKEDDVKVGVKSTSLLFGDSNKMWLTGFGIASIGCLALCGFNAHLGWPFYAFLAAASGHLTWQIATVDLSSPADCGNKFVSNIWFAALISCGIVAGKLII